MYFRKRKEGTVRRRTGRTSSWMGRVDEGIFVNRDVAVLSRRKTISFGGELCEEGQIQVQPCTFFIFSSFIYSY
jgi:hypothetical protein